MPILLIHMLPGRNAKIKKALLKNVTAAVTSTLDVRPEAVRIIINEIPFAHYGIAGLPADAQRLRPARGINKNSGKAGVK